MREQWAKRIAFLTGLLILLLAVTFARIQNPRQTPDATPSRQQAPAAASLGAIVAGRQVYRQQTCARCHSIAGEGNPRNPLDGVGGRRSAAELRDWIVGADALQGEIPARAFELKQAYKELPGGELDALVIYLQTLRAPAL